MSADEGLCESSNPVAPTELDWHYASCGRVDWRGGEVLHVGFSVAPEIDDAAASDLNEIPHASAGHRFTDKIDVRVLVPLALANGGLYGLC